MLTGNGVATGGGMLYDRAGFRTLADEFLRSRALIYLAGLLALVPGLAVVLAHNVWVADWRILITLLGWLSVIGGTLRIVFPQQMTAIGSAVTAYKSSMLIAGLVMIALGAILCFAGYFR